MSDDTDNQTHAPDDSAVVATVKRTRKQKETPSDDLFPIVLVKNYRPYGNDPKGFGDFLIERDGDLVEPGINDDGYHDRDKIVAGTTIHVPREEARRAVKLGIAQRADEF